MSNQSDRYTRSDVPDLEQSDTVHIQTNTDEHNGVVSEVSNNRDSTTITVELDSDQEVMMYADIRCVELIVDNRSQFVENIEVRD